MIDCSEEEVVSLIEATRFVPRRRAGRKTAPSTLYRWASRGCRGIRLEVLRVGGTVCTSREALQRFFERLTAQDQGEAIAAQTPTRRTAKQRAAAVASAEQELSAAGI